MGNFDSLESGLKEAQSLYGEISSTIDDLGVQLTDNIKAMSKEDKEIFKRFQKRAAILVKNKDIAGLKKLQKQFT